MRTRQLSALDQLISAVQTALTTIASTPVGTGRMDPARGFESGALSEADKRESVRLMRVNHVGEVCAQALYEGQALTARDGRVRNAMIQAASEEQDHLLWCENRLKDLEGRTSLLNPLWYLGAFGMGTVAGWAGDRWSLGFLQETEEQVEAHLDSHLDRLPQGDVRSRAVVQQMKEDERAHAQAAQHAGAAELPWPIPNLMRKVSRVMTGTARWI
ncbi:MAG TPA: demethoxyubiquinone hydroxylase family protein [Gammaproteobacteria bacterium]|nr:demethoxyubiquinone hydroxylase family protein [Gammaproteobacteria bacterium]|tara:strand:- start:401 stop:1045 length:645 start_codon:yes stop_codon:yes gene_type:complete